MQVWKGIPGVPEIARHRPPPRARTGLCGYCGVTVFSDSNFSELVVNVFTR